MIRILLLLYSLGLLIPAVRRLRRVRRDADLPFAVSLVCAGAGLALWPIPNSVVLDDLVHAPGLGHLATDVFVSLNFILQFAFATMMSDAWSRRLSAGGAARGGGRFATVMHDAWFRRRWAAVVLYGIILALYVAQWIPVHTGYSFYHGYAGRPLPVLIINLTLGALIIYPAGLAIFAYRQYLRERLDASAQLTVKGAIVIFSLAVIYGILVIGQTIVSRLGFGSTQILAVTGPITLVAGLCALVMIWLLTGLRPLWMALQAYVSLRQREAQLAQREDALRRHEARMSRILAAIIDGHVWLSDHLVQMYEDYVDKKALAQVSARCAKRTMTSYQCRVTLEAARLLTLSLANVIQTPLYLPEVPDDLQTSGADVTRAAEEEIEFLADVIRVVLLADPRPLPEGIVPRYEPPGWRRDAAEIIAGVLRERQEGQHDQAEQALLPANG